LLCTDRYLFRKGKERTNTRKWEKKSFHE
jgi:hypothetical protein